MKILYFRFTRKKKYHHQRNKILQEKKNHISVFLSKKGMSFLKKKILEYIKLTHALTHAQNKNWIWCKKNVFLYFKENETFLLLFQKKKPIRYKLLLSDIIHNVISCLNSILKNVLNWILMIFQYFLIFYVMYAFSMNIVYHIFFTKNNFNLIFNFFMAGGLKFLNTSYIKLNGKKMNEW